MGESEAMPGLLRCGTLLVALLAVLATAGTSQAAVGSWQGTLHVGLPITTPQEECDPWGECQNLRGLSVRDVNVSEFMRSIDGPADYTLTDVSSYAPLTIWRLCAYDGNHQAIDCDEKGASWWLWGTIPAETRYVRVVLVNNAAVDYSLRLTD